MLERPPGDDDEQRAKQRRRTRRNSYERRVRRGEWKLWILVTQRMRQRLVDLRQLSEDESADRAAVGRAINDLLAEALK
jgi:hypothetical protein